MTVRNYAVLYIGGKRTRSGVVVGGTIIGGGNGVLDTAQHALDGSEHTGQLPTTRLSTSETDTDLRLAPDGVGGVDFVAGVDASDLFLTRLGGEGHALITETASGATLTLDLSSGNWFDVTLTANCTIAFSNPPASGVGGEWTLILRQDATGSRTVTWPGMVDWQDTDGTDGGAAPTLYTAATAQDVITITTLDGGVSYGGGQEPAGGGGGGVTGFATPAIVLGTATAAGAATTVIRSDATIVAFDATVPTTQAFGDAAATGAAAVAARRDHKHAMPANPVAEGMGHYEVLMNGSGEPLDNGSGTDWLWVWVS